MHGREKYHYLECGLDHVYLSNGFVRFESKRGGTSITIRGIDTLHRAIGEHLCQEKKDLSAKEFRFLRREMFMSQSTLARLLDVGEQTVHRWETGKAGIPKAAEALLRFMYMEEQRPKSRVKDQLKRIADLEDEMDHNQQMIFALMADGKGQWKLAA